MPQYLLFQPGETTSNWVHNGPEDSIPEGLTAVEWDSSEDATISNYKLVKGELVYAPPVVEVIDLPPQPDTKKFFNDLVVSISTGAIPADVFVKAQMVQALTDTTAQIATLNSFSSDPTYSKSQKQELDRLIKESNLALPDVPGKD